MENNLVDIGRKFQKIRTLKGYTQDYVALKLDISQNAYSKIERGETKVHLEKLPAICKALEVELETLFQFDENYFFNNSSNSGNNSVSNAFNQTNEELIELLKSSHKELQKQLELKDKTIEKLLSKF